MDIIKQAMWIAKEEMECDAFSAMSNMSNKPQDFYDQLQFLPGDGCLHWYFVNWALGDKVVEENDIGTILL